MTPISFDVVGLPAPQGSKTRMPNGAIVEGRNTAQRAKHKNWRSAVADATRNAADQLPAPLDGPLSLHVTFRFPMPASRKKADREAGWCWKTTAPDIDKVLRATCDGIEAGGLIVNDARFAVVRVVKHEVVGWTGAEITVTELD